MLDLRCHPGGIFAVAGTILMLDIGCGKFPYFLHDHPEKGINLF
jgi:hypothetical protein